MRWLLLDQVQSILKGKKAVTLSKVPQAPYSSEVLFIEMMAQTGGLLVGAESDYQKDLIFAKIEQATITQVPKSGTPIHIEASTIQFFRKAINDCCNFKIRPVVLLFSIS